MTKVNFVRELLPVSIRGHVITCLFKFSNTSGRFLKRSKWIFFQGSAPPNFISFCLANQNEDELQASANTVPNLSATLTQVASHSSSSDPVRPPVPSPPPFPPLVPSISRIQAGDVALPYSPDSNTDVTSYADEMVQRMEEAQGSLVTETDNVVGTVLNSASVQQVPENNLTLPFPRSSTPTLNVETVELSVNLSHLETDLDVAIGSQSDLPVLSQSPYKSRGVSQNYKNGMKEIIHPPLPISQDYQKTTRRFISCQMTRMRVRRPVMTRVMKMGQLFTALSLLDLNPGPRPATSPNEVTTTWSLASLPVPGDLTIISQNCLVEAEPS